VADDGATHGPGDYYGLSLVDGLPGWAHALLVVAAVTAVVAAGHFLSRPLFRAVGSTGLREACTPASLMVVLGLTAGLMVLKALVLALLARLANFASPNAYLAYHVLPPILQRTGAQLHRIPCLLGGIFRATGNQRRCTSLRVSAASSSTISWRHGGLLNSTGYSASGSILFFFPVSTLVLMRGAFGIPTFYVEDEIFFRKKRLAQIANELLASWRRVAGSVPGLLQATAIDYTG
jgi:hypothetical protein